MKKSMLVAVPALLILAGCASPAASTEPAPEPTMSLSDVCANYRGLTSADEELGADLHELAGKATGDLAENLRILGDGMKGDSDLTNSEVRDEFTDAMDSVSATCAA